VLGGYLRKEVVAAPYSAAGSVPPPARWPDAMAPSDDSRVHSGVVATGSRSNSIFAMSGTSVSAPQIARLVADNLAGVTGPPAPLAMPGTPPERRGAGRIDTVPIVKPKRFE
jgi:hypothetical protein